MEPSISSRDPKRLAIGATCVAIACSAAIAVLPFVAHGEGDSGADPADIVPAAVLEAREEVEAANEVALEEAPVTVGAGCRETVDVPGFGPTCQTKDGRLRVELADGSISEIHGMDGPPIGVDGYAPGTTARVGSASPADIACVGADQPHYTVIYARPGNVASRMSVVAPALRSAMYQVSAFIDSESQSVDPNQGMRLPFQCDGGAPRVTEVTIPANGGSIDFDTLVNQLRATGLTFNEAAGNARYIVYTDTASSIGASGTGHVFRKDARPGAENSNNNGGLYAVQYRTATEENMPNWAILLHEVVHTMGGVVDVAPNASGGGHCNDGEDVMCYDDAAPRANYVANVCGVKVLDCNRDDYFNPSPAPGSYLASNWNVAGPANRWLQRRLAGDRTAPTAPGAVTQTGASNAAVGLAWSPSTDDVGVTAYSVELTPRGGAPLAPISTPRRSAVVAGLAANTTYDVRVVALDARGNRSAPGAAVVATNDRADLVAPGTPTNGTFRIDGRSAVLSWNDASDDVGVDAYEVHAVTTVKTKSGKATRGLREAARPTRDTTVSIPTAGMKAGVVYQFQVVARDSAGNASKPGLINVRLAKDTVKPKWSAKPRIVKRTKGAAMISWKPSTDAVGVVGYRVYFKAGAKWKLLKTSTGNKMLAKTVTKLTVKGLSSRRATTVRLAAFDAAGNIGYSAPVALRGK